MAQIERALPQAWKVFELRFNRSATAGQLSCNLRGSGSSVSPSGSSGPPTSHEEAIMSSSAGTTGPTTHVARWVWQACAVAAAAVILAVVITYALTRGGAGTHPTAPAVAPVAHVQVGSQALSVRQHDCRPISHIVLC
jgi:hypothetical protein